MLFHTIYPYLKKIWNMQYLAFFIIALCHFCLLQFLESAIFGSIVSTLGEFAAYYSVGVITERCDRRWAYTDAKFVFDNLHKDLMLNLYGQPIVVRELPLYIHNFIKYQPNKALTISFHGWTGVGKTYVREFLAKNLYYEGVSSSFVHVYTSSRHFPQKSKVESYKTKLQNEMIQHIRKCDRSLFIFDEMEKMPDGIVNALKPFIDNHARIDGYDFTKSIFIFIGNSAGEEIANSVLESWKNHIDRDDLSAIEFQNIIKSHAFNVKDGGGLWHCDLITHNLIDYFLPFLPLQRKHVKKCIDKELRDNPHASTLSEIKEIKKTVVNEIKYTPSELKLFSVSGCREVKQRVSHHLNRERLFGGRRTEL